MQRLSRRALIRVGVGATLLLGVAIGVEAAGGYSLRFHGNGSGGIDRLKIRVDSPTNAAPGPPVDVGATGFTLEFWMRARAEENTAGPVSCGANVDWIYGNIVFDRDRFNQDRKFGVSIAAGRLVFGVSGDATGDLTICGETVVTDDWWHHVAIQRRRSDGRMWIYVDGVLDAFSQDGPAGDISYPDDGVPGNYCGGPCTKSDPFLVVGAEKHDAGPQFPSFSGWIDEIRVSRVVRYRSNFTRPRRPFTADAGTVALYHLDEGAGDLIGDSSGAPGGPSHGVRKYGGSPAGPEWSILTPPLGGAPLVSLQAVATALASPVALAHAGDGSGRLFIVLQDGRIVIFDGTQVLSTPFLDIRELVLWGGERGLLGLAFHPAYASNGYFFVNYTDTAGDTVVARYQVSAGNPNVADPSSGATTLTIPQPPYPNHKGGQLQFGPEGYLYIGMGDGGSGGDPGNRAQNLGALLGKLLRIDVDSASPYAIPPMNPFVGTTGARGEIWALGLRNPWRFTFDRLTGDLFIGDVGQSSQEEIDFEPARSPGGQNYGWRRMEGSACYNPSTGCDDGTLTLPILEYDHTNGCAVTGGYRYRGRGIPRLHGMYLYADFCTGTIWRAAQRGDGTWAAAQLLDTPLQISTFGEDEAGELYVAHLSSAGALYRIVRGRAPAGG